ncbi:hypothetical protein BH10ACT1_BH10ACT1_04500 [soil metagenome]
MVEETGFEFSRGVWREVRPRIGTRQEVGLPVLWRDQTAPEKARKRLRKAQPRRSGPAIMHDLSVTGARLLVPADDAIAPSRVIELEVDGEWASVQVAWVQPSDHPSARWCGVMFLHPSARFLAVVAQNLGHANHELPAPLAWQPGPPPT